MNHGWSYREQVGPAASGLTVLDYLAATRRHSTLAEWAGRFDRAEIEVNGVGAAASFIYGIGILVIWLAPETKRQSLAK